MTQKNLHCTCTLKAAEALWNNNNGPVAVAISDPLSIIIHSCCYEEINTDLI